jgi:hypothetical protein
MTLIDLYEVKGNVLFSKITWFLKNFYYMKQSQEPPKGLKIFEIIYLFFLNILFRGIFKNTHLGGGWQKYPYCKDRYCVVDRV